MKRRKQAIERKRKEYESLLENVFTDKQETLDKVMWHQISIDIPRTYPSINYFRNQTVQNSLARTLYCWATRHPASGYVQGINDLASVFYSVFLSRYTGFDVLSISDEQIDNIDEKTIKEVEADCYCEPDGFEEFHLYTCAALLLKFGNVLEKMDFQDVLLFLQGLDRELLAWSPVDVDLLLSEAYMYKCLYSGKV
ncbi:GTPase-activating protein GYP1 [Smittium mucronatum]|uniref:GTPase-activating protein GYP1 n=1 Tax=Smittium mucronatum TaxID=133383 RepID=A0A1R0GTG2_9FUNG|nr:GTPase-activating protein GYP1 [Smittium mucronatum]